MYLPDLGASSCAVRYQALESLSDCLAESSLLTLPEQCDDRNTDSSGL